MFYSVGKKEKIIKVGESHKDTVQSSDLLGSKRTITQIPPQQVLQPRYVEI